MTRRHKRRMMGEINVVPYIDVMLVLLVIFMITAPLLSEGVKVDLPAANAKPLDLKSDETPVILTVDTAGQYYLNIGTPADKPIDASVVVARVTAVLKLNPSVHLIVRGDKNARYEQVLRGMVLLQAAGAPSVGLESDSDNAPVVQFNRK
ncbi:MAG TPA: ExbD/TolR family protein [Gammaproteobacteria bacterium]|jgi:biopolymer transport protein TolR|nr:ExbD/TolR family protein [Gammaproteobacteria bacterium]